MPGTCWPQQGQGAGFEGAHPWPFLTGAALQKELLPYSYFLGDNDLVMYTCALHLPPGCVVTIFLSLLCIPHPSWWGGWCQVPAARSRPGRFSFMFEWHSSSPRQVLLSTGETLPREAQEAGAAATGRGTS